MEMKNKIEIRETIKYLKNRNNKEDHLIIDALEWTLNESIK